VQSPRTTQQKERDARHDEAARRDLVRHDRAAGATHNLERAFRLQRAAAEFQRAFSGDAPRSAG
jgi:hypothetical protein